MWGRYYRDVKKVGEGNQNYNFYRYVCIDVQRVIYIFILFFTVYFFKGILDYKFLNDNDFVFLKNFVLRDLLRIEYVLFKIVNEGGFVVW